MYIIEDTRNKPGKHDVKREKFEDMQVSIVRSKLPFGDYALPPKIAVDTKRNIDEIAGNICGAKKKNISVLRMSALPQKKPDANYTF